MGKDDEALAREAVQLLMRLRERPDDLDAQTAAEAFRARGEAERAAWATAERVWNLTGPHKPPRGGPAGTIVILVALLGLALFVSRDTLRVWWLADHAAGSARLEVALASGDAALLDVGSSLVDNSYTGTVRRVTLLSGAAFFEVEPDARPFVVGLGAAEVEVVGTSFEATHLPGGILIAVADGVVELRTATETVRVTEGEQLRLEDGITTLAELHASGAAPWRTDRLVIDGMRFDEVASILDRRLRGPVIVRGEGLAASQVSGGLDLGTPRAGLQALAASEGARMLAVPGVGALLLGR